MTGELICSQCGTVLRWDYKKEKYVCNQCKAEFEPWEVML